MPPDLSAAAISALAPADWVPPKSWKPSAEENTGAYLTCEDADTLENLKLLESEGVTILTCGTCLDFYGLKEKLAVGGATNMYDIVERMEKAQKIIKP